MVTKLQNIPPASALYPSSPRTEKPAEAPAPKAATPMVADGWDSEPVMPYSPERNGVIRAFETVATTDVPPTPKRSLGDRFIDAIKAANTAIEAADQKHERESPRENHSHDYIPFRF